MQNSNSQSLVQELGNRLQAEVSDSEKPADPKTCQELLVRIGREVQGSEVDAAVLRRTQVSVQRAVKAIRRYKRGADDGETTWKESLQTGESLLKRWRSVEPSGGGLAKKKKKTRRTEEREPTTTTTTTAASSSGLPHTVTEYRSRLVRQQKELYKDPPVLPPTLGTLSKVDPHSTYGNNPQRDKTTGQLVFVPGKSSSDKVKSQLKDFRPNRTPEEVLRSGAFGGTYFRSIVSAVTNTRFEARTVLADTVEDEWIEGLDQSKMLTSQKYNAKINKFGVKCGGSLGMWESSGWIAEVDPYGWFQWYCRFYRGRRCDDDERQISRWLKIAGPKGRFRSQLCNKILTANADHGDASISPVIRQTLLHWGLEITSDVLEKHRKRVS